MLVKIVVNALKEAVSEKCGCLLTVAAAVVGVTGVAGGDNVLRLEP